MSGLSIIARVMIGTALLGCVAGTVGSFAVLRRRALIGDMLAHASLPGICIAFLVMNGSRNLWGLSIGALGAGLLAITVVTFVTRWTRTKQDAAIGIVLSTFFGFGVVLLSIITRHGSGHQAGLDSYLFGETASIQSRDLMTLIVVAAVTLLLVMLLYKEFKVLCFDSDFADSQGWPVTWLDMTLMTLLAVVTILGLQIVGVVLMAAMLIIPGTTARYWTDRLGRLVIISAGLGAAAGVVGTWLASPYPEQMLGFDPLAFGDRSKSIPPGPLIVLSASTFFVVSLLFAPRRGILSRLWAEFQLRIRIFEEHLMRSLYEHSEPQLPNLPSVATASIVDDRSWNWLIVRWLLHTADRRGWILRDQNQVQLTSTGLDKAAAVTRSHRLWELFLVEHANIASDHVDRDADDVEHLLPARLLDELEDKLAKAGRLPESPHGLPSQEASR